MRVRRDWILIVLILAAAVLLYGVNRFLPKRTVEGRTAEITMAPDSVTIIEENAAPVSTEAPAVTEAPVVTQAPAVTEAPVVTQAPAATEAPVVTQTPAATEAPVVTQAPAATEAPVVTQTPAATEAPIVTQTPAATEAPVATQTPATDVPAETKEPFVTEPPAMGSMIGPMLPHAKTTTEVRGHVIVTLNGRQYGDPIPMDRDKIITVRQEDGKINCIHITPESVVMESSTCENQDCVGQGEISLENYKTRILSTYIICLPNGVTVEMVPAEAE